MTQLISRFLIPYDFEKYLLFFNKHECKLPPDFCTMPQAERNKLRKERRADCVHPTTTNHWIWFGAYTQRLPHQATHHKLGAVQRHLYKEFVDQSLDHTRRITNHFTQLPSDVNPFQCSIAAPRQFRHMGMHRNLRGQRAGTNSVGGSNVDVVYEQLMSEGYGSLSAQTIRMVLAGESYDPVMIEAVLKKMEKE